VGEDAAIVYVDRSLIRPGKVDELLAALRDLAALVEAEEPRIAAYQVHLDASASSVTVVHIHPDAASLDRHFAVAAAAFPRFATLVDLESIDVYGQPTQEAIAALRRKAELLGGARVTIHPQAVGFARVGAAEPARSGSA
jgi:quinol monooxygenase YgiN